MSFETDDRQLRMDAEDNTENITYPQIENDIKSGAENNNDGRSAENNSDNKISPDENKADPKLNEKANAQRPQEDISRVESTAVKRGHKATGSPLYNDRPAKKRRKKGLGSKSSFGAGLNSTNSALPRKRERLEEIQEPAKVLHADDGFTGKFTWPGPKGMEHAPQNTALNVSDTSDITKRADKNTANTSETEPAPKTKHMSGSQTGKFQSGKIYPDRECCSAAKYQSGIGEGVKNIINQIDTDSPVVIEDITAEDSLTLSMPKIDIAHTQIHNRQAVKKADAQTELSSSNKHYEINAIEKQNEENGSAPPRILTALIEKPQILLETPYSVLTKGGPHLRYRLEYGYADTKIPEQEQSIPGDSFSPLELDALNHSIPVAEGKKKRAPKKRKSLGKEIFGWIKLLAAALILALLVRQFVFVLVWVEGSSMEPTLMNQERIIVTRYDYIFGSPQRQDIVICHFPDGEDKDNYVKRIIGLPGERISIDDGIVYINGEALEEPYVVYEKIQDMQEITIPEDMYFLMGDNRFNSRDSRVVGLIERSQIQGHVRYVFYPFEDMRSVD